jgi:hypothetical protein
MSEMRILLLAAEQGPNVLFCMPNRTKCILLVSVMYANRPSASTHTIENSAVEPHLHAKHSRLDMALLGGASYWACQIGPGVSYPFQR